MVSENMNDRSWQGLRKAVRERHAQFEHIAWTAAILILTGLGVTNLMVGRMLNGG